MMSKILNLENDNLPEELKAAFDEIQQPRTPYALKHFVVGAHHTEEQRYAQCVLEMQIAHDNLRLARLSRRRKEIEIEKLPKDDLGNLDRQVKQIEIEQTDRAILGAMREFEALYELWQAMPRKFTREELDQASSNEFAAKLLTQAKNDVLSFGRVQVGNLEGLRQAGLPAPLANIAVDPRSIESVERRYLEQGKFRILIGTPSASATRPESLPCQEGIQIPAAAEYKSFCVYSRPIDEAFTFIVREALRTEATYLFTVEDDTFPPPDALIRLFALVQNNPRSLVGAWYPKRSRPREGAHIVCPDSRERGPMIDDGTVQEAYTLAMGCSLYPIQVFKEIPEPWFKTTTHLTQDSYFSQLAREAGWRLLVDTSVKCKHIDRVTGEVYE